MRRFRLKVSELKTLPKWPVNYGKRLTVMVPYPENPREGKCDACGRKIQDGAITTTQLHHWIYAYRHATIKKNPLLVLENCNEFCYPCHQLADALRALVGHLSPEKMWMVIKVAALMPDKKPGEPVGKSMKEKLDWVCRGWIEKRKNERRGTLDGFARNP